MEDVKSACASAWNYICQFVSSAASWAVSTVQQFCSWFSTTVCDIIARIKTALGRPSLTSEERAKLEKFERSLAAVNNEFEEVKPILEKAVASGSAEEKRRAAGLVTKSGEIFRCAAA